MGKFQNIALFVPHQGCPQDCVLCNQSRITGQNRADRLTEKTIIETIEANLATMAPDDQIEIAFFGGSFTGLPRSYQTLLLSTANRYIDGKRIKGIRISTRPDYINKAILDYLAGFRVTTIELGVQSMVQEVLDRTKRGHSVEDTRKAVRLIQEDKRFQLGLQLLPGLPGDSLERSIHTAYQVALLKPDFVRIYPALVIKGTELAWDYALGYYQPMTMPEAVERVAKMWLIFMKHGIPVIRIGLQPSEDLREEGTVIAGPFHPAFRQIVEGYLFHQLLGQIASEHQQLSVLYIHPADETSLRGKKSRQWDQFVAQLEQPPVLRFDRQLTRGSIRVETVTHAQKTYTFTQLYEESLVNHVS